MIVVPRKPSYDMSRVHKMNSQFSDSLASLHARSWKAQQEEEEKRELQREEARQKERARRKTVCESLGNDAGKLYQFLKELQDGCQFWGEYGDATILCDRPRWREMMAYIEKLEKRQTSQQVRID